MKDFREQLKLYINWLAVAVLSVALSFVRLFRIDGGFTIKDFPSTWQGWLIWSILVFAPPTIGIMILSAFRNEGLRQGHKIDEVKKIKDEWMSLMSKDKKIKLRSKKEYLKQAIIKDGTIKFTFASALSVVTAVVAVGVDISGLISLAMQLLVFIGGGMMTYFSAMDYCTDELIGWYGREIERIKSENNLKDEPIIEAKNIKENGGT